MTACAFRGFLEGPVVGLNEEKGKQAHEIIQRGRRGCGVFVTSVFLGSVMWWGGWGQSSPSPADLPTNGV